MRNLETSIKAFHTEPRAYRPLGISGSVMNGIRPMDGSLMMFTEKFYI